MKTTKEMIEIMKAFDEGKEIQFQDKYKNSIYIAYDGECPFNWEKYDYRVKPEPKKRPMTFEEIVDYWKQHRTEIFTIIHEDIEEDNEEVFISGVNYENKSIYFGKLDYDASSVWSFVRKEDGSRFEVEE